MGIFGKPNIDKLKSKGDVKALRKELVSRDRQDSPEVAQEAAVALLDLDATDVLLEALHHDVVSRNLICLVGGALRATGSEKAYPILYDLSVRYANPDPGGQEYVRRSVRGDLAALPGAWLSSALQRRDDAYLLAAVRCVGDAARRATVPGTGIDDRTTAGLVTCLRHERAEIRAAAAGALDGVDDGEARTALADCLQDESPEVRAAAAAAIGEDPRATAVLIGNLHVEDPDLRLAAIQSLGASANAEAGEPLAGLLSDPDPRVRSAAAHALAALGDARGLDVLTGIAEEAKSDSQDRARAAASLGGIGAEAVPVLVRLLSGDPSLGVKADAARSLARLGWVPTIDEAGAFFLLATGDVGGCRRMGAKATRPLMEYVPKAMYVGLNKYSLLELAGEVADRRIVPTLEHMVQEARDKEDQDRRLLGGLAPAFSAQSIEIEHLQKAIASIIARSTPIAGPEWTRLLDLAALPLGQAMVVEHQLDAVVTCPSCESTMRVRDAYRPGASFLACPRCHDEWMIRYLTGRYERIDAAPVAG